MGYFGYFANGIQGLKALDTATLATKWLFNGDSSINTAPIVVNGYVYVASHNGTLYALDAQSGVSVWTTHLGANMPWPDESNAELLSGLAAANGMLVVPVGDRLIAFQSGPPMGPIQLLLETSAPLADQVAAFDSLLFLRDPFPVLNVANPFNSSPDKNTRVILFVANLQPLPNEASSSIIVNLRDSNNQSYDIAAEDVRPIPNLALTQVVFRLPNNVASGRCTVSVKANGQTTNPGRMTIK